MSEKDWPKCDCPDCHGDGIVGSDGACCECIKMGCHKWHRLNPPTNDPVVAKMIADYVANTLKVTSPTPPMPNPLTDAEIAETQTRLAQIADEIQGVAGEFAQETPMHDQLDSLADQVRVASARLLTELRRLRGREKVSELCT